MGAQTGKGPREVGKWVDAKIATGRCDAEKGSGTVLGMRREQTVVAEGVLFLFALSAMTDARPSSRHVP